MLSPSRGDPTIAILGYYSYSRAPEGGEGEGEGEEGREGEGRGGRGRGGGGRGRGGGGEGEGRRGQGEIEKIVPNRSIKNVKVWYM